MFMPTQTINGVIKKANLHDVTPLELIELNTSFNELNEGRVPRPGQVFTVPILDRHSSTGP
jgi:hypothetical protein